MGASMAMEGGMVLEALEPRFSLEKGKMETPLQFLCPALLLGLRRTTLIIMLSSPPFNMRSGGWWETGWSCGAGAVQASAGLQPLTS